MLFFLNTRKLKQSRDIDALFESYENGLFIEKYTTRTTKNVSMTSTEFLTPTTSLNVTEKRKIVVIATFMRSGSTFLGEFFNVHRDCFYQFEPLHAEAKYDGQKLTKYDFLKTRFDCKFEDMYDRSKTWSSQNLNVIDTRGNFIFRRKSRRLCKPPFCRSDHSHSIIDCSGYCGDVNPMLASKVCSKLTPVIKTIRLTQFDILNRFNIDGTYDPKFIFLVRDPRQVY